MAALDWWRAEVVPHVSPAVDQRALTAATAVALLGSEALSGRRLGCLLPELEALPHTPSFLASTRAYRVLQHCSADTWADLAQRSVLGLSEWPGCGRRTVMEILEITVGEWIEASCPAPPEASASSEDGRLHVHWTTPRRWPDWADPKVNAALDLQMLCRAAYPAGARDIGEAVGLATARATRNDGAIEDLLARAWQRLLNVKIEELLDVERGLEAAWAAVLEFSERELRILEARCPTHPARVTLEALSREFAVTRERIRQIDRRCRRAIAARLEDNACVVILHHAARLRQQLGTVVPAEVVDAALQPLLPCDAQHELLCRDIVLTHAGPYRFEDGLWQAGSPLAEVRVALRGAPRERLTDDQLDRLMDDAGVVGDHREACRAALDRSARGS